MCQIPNFRIIEVATVFNIVWFEINIHALATTVQLNRLLGTNSTLILRSLKNNTVCQITKFRINEVFISSVMEINIYTLATAVQLKLLHIKKTHHQKLPFQINLFLICLKNRDLYFFLFRFPSDAPSSLQHAG